MFRPTLCFVALVAVALVSACSEADSAELPAGVTCASTATASDAASLAKSLEGAASKSCVVVTGALTVSEPVTVKSGVILVGSRSGGSIAFKNASDRATITLADGAEVGHLTVSDAPQIGILISGANGHVFDVNVTGAAGAGLAIAGSGAGTIRLDNVALVKNGYGLYASGAGPSIVVTGGRIAENGGTSLTAGAGVIVAHGANVELADVRVENNEGTGVIADGAATKLSIHGGGVSENHERGVWAQGLDGSIDAPALKLENVEVARNRIIGVGGIETRGIIIIGGRVAETVASPVPTNLATTESIGDGLGLFGGSTDLKIQDTAIEANARAAGVVDGSEVGIIIIGGRVAASSTGLKFVVQNSKADVQIADADKSVPEEALPISAPRISIPSGI